MNFEFSNNLKYFQTGIFNVLNDKKAELIKQGKKVYNLSVGTPDFEPDEHVKQALIDCAKNSKNWKYSLDDMPELIDALISYYKNRFNVNLNFDEIMSVYGSQEGLTHIGFSLCNKDDIVLVPNPGYPIFEIGPYLSGAEISYYPLLPENNYLPDLYKIDEDILKRTKFMVVSYPMNPVCATAPLEFYDELIVFAKKHNIIIIHDNAYSDIVYDGECGGSFLSHEGAKEVGVEFYSLSKSFNITGARVSFVIGNSEIIKHFKMLRSQIDYGIFKPIQHAAIAALIGPQDSVKLHCKEYEKRRNALCRGLSKIGWNVPDSKGSMFAWAPIPSNFKSSSDFCMELMEKTGVICTPGSAFGSLGEGYVRFALVLPVPIIEEAVSRIAESGILKTK
ncbi:aminotransferase class I/II-fold pyridoxal phosphate-dependent enzyme [Clostridium butyricum]|uniref:aminotransferase class I/II-fold pyridoxal phosphate-dependent enzyme n=1 Tax=Clostridium butyricum TaxID=1492 RepID=UPI00071BF01C|nr:aminotransferase class I/II-fold pyridoxal phosphate-dependent enzyme [Clostridium butyricum]ALP90675.1 LL-diaminopimelate aminotransferase [Clostridium butyricum]ANF14298.1 LL-diaminopimelate aminotransferase [Clostridium butyricum]AOR94363.1 LL-diaminopimelate aminotransferase [Clostridium butyricum]MCI3008501.1 aminotransferase class I/II-fold pyridoxal phosphate-dependent enzyme [Clostridium butyricum]MDP0840550.1 aminotransferase class I/II-fold pyridoxal phosphate-dependent enzyme [Cl